MSNRTTSFCGSATGHECDHSTLRRAYGNKLRCEVSKGVCAYQTQDATGATAAWERASKPWAHYPVGTKARESWFGGYWTKTEMGWRWCTGSTFPTPGGADQVQLP